MPRIRGENLADHRERTWTALTEALDGLLTEHSFEQVSLGDVAARAGIARNTVYNYAPDKTALLAATVEHSGTAMAGRIEEIAEDRAASPTARITAIVEALLKSFSTETHRLFVLQSQLQPRASEDLAAAGPYVFIKARFVGVVREGVARGEFRDTGDVHLDIELVSGLLEAGVRRIARDPANATGVMERTTAMVIRCLRSE